ncbi:hypothetical protein [Portibacter marinus]|uniref:hypothetical protein n=1 Tax=Portibacter marinus TaxID=2898660 RepID=UPI001F4051E7|nr:hypothetical protein [Portibacter marinus]
MKRITIAILFILCHLGTNANNLSISSVSLSGNFLTFTVQWENSWRQGLEFHDAVWIFIKQAPNGGPSWTHGNISSAQATSGYETIVSSDNVGFFVRRSADGNGTSTVQLQAQISNPEGAFQDFKVFGVEMVYIPQGNFYAGDGVSTSRITPGDDISKSYLITSEAGLFCGSGSTNIDIASATSTGRCVDLDPNFPKGFEAFYSMKYSITQEQYVDFLNCLPRNQQENNVQADISGTSVTNTYVMADQPTTFNGNVIRCPSDIGNGNITFFCDRDGDGVPNESDDGLGRAMNYICSQNWAAYLDWAGLRPMSFLEYEKASRGPLPAVPGEFSWGSSLLVYGSTIIDEGTATEKYTESGTTGGVSTYANDVLRVGFNAIAPNPTRELSNASYYGVIDLGNNPSDFYVDYEEGLTYTGNHGDGKLSLDGNANVVNWPDTDCAGFPIKLSIANSSSVSGQGLSLSGASSSGGGRGVRNL